MGRKKAITEDMKEEVIQLYEQLGLVGAVADRLGVSFPTAGQALRAFGVDTNKRNDISKGSYHPKLGIWPDQRVADDLGVTRQSVYKARTRRGIQSAYERAMSIINVE